jgi:hypothetical protein
MGWHAGPRLFIVSTHAIDAHPRLGIVDAERTAFVVETIVGALTHRVIIDKAQEMSELEDEATPDGLSG